MIWHQKLDHPSFSLFSALIKQQGLPVSKSHVINCSFCNMAAKSHKLQFPKSETFSTVPFQLLHMDVWGPSPIPSHKGYRYYLLIVDDFSRFTWLFPLHYKSEVKHVVAQFKAYVNTQFHMTIQTLRSDNGGEFINNFLLNLFLTNGMLQQTACPHTPEQNGIAERKHRHLIETTITLLLKAQMPTSFWLEALTTAVYLVNRLPHSSIQFQIPCTLLFQKSPNYLFLKPFGCCLPWLKPYNSHKLHPKSTPCVFLGYCPHTRGYRCFDPCTNKVYVSRHVKFVETEFPYSALVNSSSSPTPSPSYTSFHVPLTIFEDIIIPVCYPVSPLVESSVPVSASLTSPIPHSSSSDSSSVSSPSSSVPNVSTVVPESFHSVIPTSSSHPNNPAPHSMTTRSKHGIFKPKAVFSLNVVGKNPSLLDKESVTFSEAMKYPVWKQAMSEEYSALVKQRTWSLVPPPFGEKIIGCQWIFKSKRHSDGTVSRYKARSVANGNQHAEGVDFNETFSPMIKQPTVKVIL